MTLEELELRVAAIEARQRAAGIHDSWCPLLRVERAQFVPIVVAEPVICSCWLST